MQNEESLRCPNPRAERRALGILHCAAAPRDVPSSRARWWARTSPRYWVCLLILLSAAAGLRTAARTFGLYFRKTAVPLKTPLRLLDVRLLGPRYELNKTMTDRMPPMSEDMIESLGTQEYIQIYLTDTQARADDPTRLALLFVTYYTGKPDMVPHVPDECWLAGGYERVSATTRSVHAAGIEAKDDQVPVRVMEFRAGKPRRALEPWSGTTTVLYFFHANGIYATTRDGVRRSMSNPFQRYAYYAKVEVLFSSESGLPAGREASVAALGPLLERVMPVLLNNHFDLEKFTGG